MVMIGLSIKKGLYVNKNLSQNKHTITIVLSVFFPTKSLVADYSLVSSVSSKIETKTCFHNMCVCVSFEKEAE